MQEIWKRTLKWTKLRMMNWNAMISSIPSLKPPAVDAGVDCDVDAAVIVDRLIVCGVGDRD